MEHLSEPGPDERNAITRQILDMDRRLVTLLRAGMQSDFLQSDLTMPQLKVLLLLTSEESGHLHMSQLSQALRVTMPTATGIVDRLVEQRLGFLRLRLGLEPDGNVTGQNEERRTAAPG